MKPLTAHELARKLLELPDIPVAFTDGDGEGWSITDAIHGDIVNADGEPVDQVVELLSE